MKDVIVINMEIVLETITVDYPGRVQRARTEAVGAIKCLTISSPAKEDLLCSLS